MAAPYDRPAPGGTAGGCSCNWCGVIYIGAEWQDGCCAVCLRDIEARAAQSPANTTTHRESAG